jgi:hypothetical protein
LLAVWSIKQKRSIESREADKSNARLNPGGHKQEYRKTYSQVVWWTSIQLILIPSVISGWSAITERKGIESSLQLKVTHVKNQLRIVLVLVWQLSTDRKALSLPLQGRMTVPFADISIDHHNKESLGEAGEWADLSVVWWGSSCDDKFMQTKNDTRSIEVQTEVINKDNSDVEITESNINSLMFMMGPQLDKKQTVNWHSILCSRQQVTNIAETSHLRSLAGIFTTAPVSGYTPSVAQPHAQHGPDQYENALPNDTFLFNNAADFLSTIHETYLL